MKRKGEDIGVFDRDAELYGGYVYTTSKKLSTKLALQRSLDIILQTKVLAGRSVLDMGCGDGFFSIRLWDQGQCRAITGVDAAHRAVEIADVKKEGRPIRFMVGDVHNLPFPDNSFDVVLLQSMLHHVDDPMGTIREAFRLAPEVLIHESNGNNLALRVIAKTSRYHREHDEKVFSTYRMRRWIERSGGKIAYKRFANFVPMFCPDWMAKTMKFTEPAVESFPLLNSLLCSVYVILAKRCR